jgi:hypothetical protein
MLSNIHAPMALPSVRQLELEIDLLDNNSMARESLEFGKSWI